MKRILIVGGLMAGSFAAGAAVAATVIFTTAWLAMGRAQSDLDEFFPPLMDDEWNDFAEALGIEP